MIEEKGNIRIVAEKLGTVAQVIEFLTEFENAYKHIYAFEFIVDTLKSEYDQNSENDRKRFEEIRNFWKEFGDKKIFLEDPFFYEYFLSEYISKDKNRPNLINVQSLIEINKLILPKDNLVIAKVNIQSLGFWEFFGSLSPLNQIREYLNDRHERKKDNHYRSRQEEQIGELEISERQNRILNQRIEILKSLGYSKTQIRQMVNSLVEEPLNRLNRFQDSGQIEGSNNNASAQQSI